MARNEQRRRLRAMRSRGFTVVVIIALGLVLEGSTIISSCSRISRDQPEAGRWVAQVFWHLVSLLSGLAFGILAWRWGHSPKRCGIVAATLTGALGVLWSVQLVTEGFVRPWAEGQSIRVYDSAMSIGMVAIPVSLALWVFLGAARDDGAAVG